MKEKYVVTGGAGFIGHHLAKALLARGDEVRVLDDLSTGHRDRVPDGARLVPMDIADPQRFPQMVAAMDGCAGVFHLAARPRVQLSLKDPMGTTRVNAFGTLCVLEAARNASVACVVNTSSSSVYGNQDSMPLSEHLHPQPMSPYALQKWQGEQWCQLYSQIYGVRTVSLRPFNVSGPGSDPNGPYALVMAKFINQRFAGLPLTITGDGEQTRDFTHVSDVVRAYLMAMEKYEFSDGQVFNIGAGRPVSINRIAQLVGGPTVHIDARPGEPRHTHADITKAQVYLGWKPTLLVEECIAELIVLAELAQQAHAK